MDFFPIGKIIHNINIADQPHCINTFCVKWGLNELDFYELDVLFSFFQFQFKFISRVYIIFLYIFAVD